MSMTDAHRELGVSHPDGRRTDAASTARAADRPASTGAVADEVLIVGELAAREEFIVRVLRRAHQAVEPVRSAGEHRGIWRVARLFADELERTDPGFDRMGFLEAVAGGRSHA